MQDREGPWRKQQIAIGFGTHRSATPKPKSIGPALDDAEITAWEAQHGIRLPAILHRAYRQQDGGRVRGSERGAALVRLRDFQPKDVQELDMTGCQRRRAVQRRGGSSTSVTMTPARTSCSTILTKTGAEPSAYFHYNDGGTMEEVGSTIGDLWVSTSQ